MPPTVNSAPNGRPVDLLAAIAAIANDATRVEQALSEALTQVCTFTGWPIGHAYLVSEGDARPTRLWHVDQPRRYAAFLEASESISLVDSKGLIRHVLSARSPVWVDDVSRDPTFQRAPVAKAVGLGCALALPVLAGAEVAAVLEFFTTRPAERDDELLGLMRTVGVQLGRMIERARATELVHVEQERYRILFESSADAILAGGPDGLITGANAAACRLLGYPEAELIGREPKELVAPEWVELVQRSIAVQIQGEVGSSRYEIVMLDRAGARIPVEVSLTVLRDGESVVGTHAVVRDLRDRRRAERALRESEERFRGAFEAAPIGMALSSLDGRWLKVNAAFCTIVGYTADELLTMRFQEITHPDDLAPDVALGERMLAGELPSYGMDKRYIRKDGSVVWVHLIVSLVRDEEGAPAYSVAQVLDIDERKRRELGRARLRSCHPGASPLSPREREVLGLLAEGHTSGEVSATLGITEETVQTHVRRAMAKLEARSRTQAVASAIRLGWLDTVDDVAAA